MCLTLADGPVVWAGVVGYCCVSASVPKLLDHSEKRYRALDMDASLRTPPPPPPPHPPELHTRTAHPTNSAAAAHKSSYAIAEVARHANSHLNNAPKPQ